MFGCCVPPSSRSHRNQRPGPSLYFYFFAALFNPPKRRVSVLPHTFHLVAFPLQRPTHHQHHCSVDCCVSSSRGSHPRPVLRPSLNLSMGAILAPQTSESVAVSANPCTCHLQLTHREPWHHNLGPWRMMPWRVTAKPLWVGWCTDGSVDTMLVFVMWDFPIPPNKNCGIFR